MFDQATVNLLIKGLLESLYMVLVSTLLAYVIGLPVGILLVITDKDGIRPAVGLNRTLGFIVNILRSVPFLILLVALIPFTRKIVGTTIGSTATIVPLVIGSAPFIARLVESSIKEIDRGVIEAAQSMGASPIKIIYKVMLPEAKPALVINGAIAITTILSYSALAGFVGGGGLGTIAINYGYHRYQTDIMLVTVVLLVILVQVFQEIGMKIARSTDKRL
ncbi:D-methionine transport system permease protein [Hydrogenoanaerobacterium saccharovorans]|uniref:D-methionine transport system permease protein n=1 Tax=Hydrogenoanaerobacterium saccharovorans TaxID=474960 RepID=A0A1H8A0U7_9FIRM|nr:methionine ABC transporter permease [Hydrogenoanaerobacterium saccharovorans]RPF48288.1 D-methionine transport system permease protein [Hydrogenoanaerobacterium saccharovorans]SEM63468.1 D-methionine transport system permease protein [Hydrogenoanaerobacterium saccharovorans]